MRFIDDKFKKNRSKYILQCVLAALIVLTISVFMDVFLQTATIASLGATIFILFTMPHTRRSRPKYVLGGYTIGIGVGTLCFIISELSSYNIENFLVALAVGLCIFLMVITDSEHPPAAAIAMGIAIEGADLRTIIILYGCLAIVIIGKQLLNKWLINLL
jgi:CBS-domain-containing membrane protein